MTEQVPKYEKAASTMDTRTCTTRSDHFSYALHTRFGAESIKTKSQICKWPSIVKRLLPAEQFLFRLLTSVLTMI